MQYEIKGGAFPVVVCQLAERRADDDGKGLHGLDEPQYADGDAGGGLGKMFSKAFSGESMFQNIYTARGRGHDCLRLQLSGADHWLLTIAPGQEMILQKSAFLAAEPGVELSIHFNKRLGAGLFGGEGFIMQRLGGQRRGLCGDRRRAGGVRAEGGRADGGGHRQRSGLYRAGVTDGNSAGAGHEKQAAGRRGSVQYRC